MLKIMREQVQDVLYAVPARRKPALRRSDLPDALFATDLPLAAQADAVEAFCLQMERMGWRIGQHHGWLILDAVVPVPKTAIPDALAGECGSCISLLLRHPDDAPAEEYVRAAVKAEDAGIQPFKRFCDSLHKEFAARLRRREALPGALLPYLCHAFHKLRT